MLAFRCIVVNIVVSIDDPSGCVKMIARESIRTSRVFRARNRADLWKEQNAARCGTLRHKKSHTETLKSESRRIYCAQQVVTYKEQSRRTDTYLAETRLVYAQCIHKIYERGIIEEYSHASMLAILYCLLS